MLCPKSVLITGGNRGIGLELVKHFLKLEPPPTHVFATCRSPDNAKELNDIARRNSSLTIVKLEVTDQASIDTARDTVREKLDGRGLNLLINNAGIPGYYHLRDVTAETMVKVYKVNCVAPLMISKAFIPLLKSASKADAGEPISCSRAAIINISSDLGSMSENNYGTKYEYRASKAALNMVTTNLALELKSDGIIATAVHPGWVRTDLGGSDAPIDTNQSVTKVMNVLAKLQGEDGTGKLYHFKGHIIDW